MNRSWTYKGGGRGQSSRQREQPIQKPRDGRVLHPWVQVPSAQEMRAEDCGHNESEDVDVTSLAV